MGHRVEARFRADPDRPQTPEGTVAANVLAHGTGGLNIDGSRFGDGRWPVNVALDDGQAVVLDALTASLGDSEPVSERFPVFRYRGKAPQPERPRAFSVSHSTDKPLASISWLVGLLTPEGGVMLEPFAGSGTTVEAALAGGFRAVAVEKDETFTRHPNVK